MTPTNDNATAGLVAELRRTPGWPALGNAAADAITALQSRLAEVEAERDTAYDALNVERAAVWRVSEHLDAALSREKALKVALEFYADVSKYPAPLTGGMGALWSDCGATARNALAQSSGADAGGEDKG